MSDSGNETMVLGVDIGGTGVKAAPVDVNAGTLTAARNRILTPNPSVPEAVADVVASLVEHFEWRGPIGCGMPSVVRDGVVCTAANLDKSWVGADGRALLARRTGCPFALVNDADAAGMAEMAFGAGRDRRGVVVMITLGTGIGTALFVDGKLVPNSELGHLVIRGKDAEHRASERARATKKWSYKKWAKHVDEYLRYVEALLWPDLFIIGGGVSKHHEKFIPLLTVSVPVVPATMRNEAGIVGAALAVRASGTVSP